MVHDSALRVLYVTHYTSLGGGANLSLLHMMRDMRERHSVIPSVLFRDIFRQLQGKHFDIIHTNSSVTEAGSLIARRLSAPHVWHIREFGS